MTQTTPPGGRFTFAGSDLTVARMGYGTMQLAGPHVFGPPRDRAQAVAVLREAVALGVNHIDTADFYGPHVTNEIIREALHPYPDDLVLVTKIGFRRGADASWKPDYSPAHLAQSVKDNLQRLGVAQMHVVNLRMGGAGGTDEKSLAEPLGVLMALQREGLVRHLGVSNVSAAQVKQARAMTDIVCVQNQYNLAHRADDAMVDELRAAGIAYVPFFPLGGFTPLQSSALEQTAQALGKTPLQVALAWLLHRSPNILLIPGTSSVAHLRENLQAAEIQIPAEHLATLDGIGAKG